MMRPLVEVVPTRPGEGELRFNFHRGQLRAFGSRKRIVLVLAGTQGGKTVLGPPWLYQEIQRRGPGDYLVVSPSFPLMAKKTLPEFLRLFRRRLKLGEYKTQAKVFEFSDAGERQAHGGLGEERTQIFFGHAQDPESLESATAKACWADEAGQKKFRLGSYEAVMRRLSIHQGRLLITTTPYDLAWLKQRIWDPWRQANGRHPHIDVVGFKSKDNPAFPAAEWERAKRDLPGWKFALFYEARFTRPAGLIYDSFDDEAHVRPPFKIPEKWQRYVGVDFGGVNLAAVFFAAEENGLGDPTGRLWCYRTYHPGGKRKPAEHVKAILEGEPRIPTVVGGAGSEDDWRDRFADAGLPIVRPEIRDVEVGIDAVWACFSRGDVLLFESLAHLRDELASYSRVVNEQGEPTKEIEDKAQYHLLDACRYVLGWLRGDAEPAPVGAPPPEAMSEMSKAPSGVFMDDGMGFGFGSAL